MLFKNKALIQLETVDSTNNYAASMVKLSKPPEGTVITSLEQTEGKGQRGAVWVSTPGANLLMSMILYPPFIGADDLFGLSQVVSLAAAEVVESLTDKDTCVKWPNDIMVQDRKIAGILIESAWTDSRLQSAVCGIGLNVNELLDIHPNATSLFKLTGKHHDLDLCRELITNRIEAYYLRLRTGQQSAIHQEYQSKLYRLNQSTRFTRAGDEFTATITGVTRSGRLQLCRESGETSHFNLKEVQMILP